MDIHSMITLHISAGKLRGGGASLNVRVFWEQSFFNGKNYY